MTYKLNRRDFATADSAGAAALAGGGIALTTSQLTAKEEAIYDAVAEKKKLITGRFEPAGKKARAASDAGKLKLVREFIHEPYKGIGFKVDKGQVLRDELSHGPQILDTVYLVRSRPIEEWADTWMTGVFGALTLHEGMHYFSCTPYARPLLTIIKDTVDYDNLEKKFGKGAAHSFIFPSGRCTESLWEIAYGVKNAYSCNSGLLQGIIDVAGEDVARALRFPPGVFMHFQCLNYDKIPTHKTYYSGRGNLKVGDHIELLAHEDLYAGVSPCPLGDQHNMEKYEDFTCYPVKIQIYEGADGPLETAPDPDLKSMNAIDYILKGRPGMVTGKTRRTEVKE